MEIGNNGTWKLTKHEIKRGDKVLTKFYNAYMFKPLKDIVNDTNWYHIGVLWTEDQAREFWHGVNSLNKSAANS